jgi:hypothetical protein
LSFVVCALSFVPCPSHSVWMRRNTLKRERSSKYKAQSTKLSALVSNLCNLRNLWIVRVCQQLKIELAIAMKPTRPAESVKDHSTSGLGRRKTLRQITIPLFHPSCWYSGNRFPTASSRFTVPKIVPHAIPLIMKLTVTPASNTNSCCNSGRLCKADISIRR